MLLLISLIFALLHLPGDSGPFEHGPYDTWEYHNNAVYISNISINDAQPLDLPKVMHPKVQPFIKPEPTEGACSLVDGFGWSGLSWPVGGRDIRENRLFGAQGNHRGVDILSPVGQPVYAASTGVVVWAGVNYSGWGVTVILAHGGGYQTIYAHLQSENVQCGQVVARGDVIGVVGMTGLSSFPHLHFEVRAGGFAVDPLLYLHGANILPASVTVREPLPTPDINKVMGGNQ